ncbi:MAG: YwmB family TATA-box binding protein [Clostridia bacterium]|nr:YwmB family TATA-box binding protein [Clostridia bacterium]
MKKKVFTISMSLVVLFIIILFSAYFVRNAKNPNLSEAAFVKSFKSSGAHVINSELYFWARMEDKIDDMEKVKSLALDFSKKLGLIVNNKYSNREIQNDHIKKCEISGVTDDEVVVNIIVQANGKTEAGSERFVSVSIVEDMTTSGLEEVKRTALNVFEKHNLKPKVNMCITGNYDGKLEYNELNEVCKRIFKDVEAEKVEGMRDENLISVSAYSPFIEDSIKVNGKKINLNLAIRYNSSEDKTYIWLATPVISTEY